MVLEKSRPAYQQMFCNNKKHYIRQIINYDSSWRNSDQLENEYNFIIKMFIFRHIKNYGPGASCSKLG